MASEWTSWSLKHSLGILQKSPAWMTISGVDLETIRSKFIKDSWESDTTKIFNSILVLFLYLINMALTVIGGSSYVGRYLIKSLSGGFKDVRLGDMYPFRQSVYRLQEEVGDKLSKHPLSYSINLKQAVEGSQDIIVVTHDYFKLAYSKNFYVEKTAIAAKNAGATKLVIVAPRDLDQLNKLDGDPEALIQASINKARQFYPNLSVIRTNLLFGQNCTSLIIHNTLEALKNGKSIITANDGKSKFQPVFEEDLLKAYNEIQPKDTVELAGPETLTWKEIAEVLAKHANVSSPAHDGALSKWNAWVSTCERWGDIIYPSHISQLYRVLKKDMVFEANKTGITKFTEFYAPSKFQGVQELDWHKVILD